MLPVVVAFQWVIEALILLIIVDALLSWVPNLKSQFREVADFIGAITDPILKPIRSILPPTKTGGLDLSPLLAIMVLQIIQRLVVFLF